MGNVVVAIILPHWNFNNQKVALMLPIGEDNWHLIIQKVG